MSTHKPSVAEIQDARKWAWEWLVKHVAPSEVSRNRLCDSLAHLLLDWEYRQKTPQLESQELGVVTEETYKKRLQDALELLEAMSKALPPGYRTRVSAETFIAAGGSWDALQQPKDTSETIEVRSIDRE